MWDFMHNLRACDYSKGELDVFECPAMTFISCCAQLQEKSRLSRLVRWLLHVEGRSLKSGLWSQAVLPQAISLLLARYYEDVLQCSESETPPSFDHVHEKTASPCHFLAIMTLKFTGNVLPAVPTSILHPSQPMGGMSQ